MTALRLTLILCVLGWSAQAQYPGQYPPGPGRYPPGGYPPGGYPPGQGPTQNPPNSGGGSRGRQPAQSRNSKAGSPVVTTTTGILRVVAGGQFVLQADDHRIMTYRAGDKIEYLKDGKAVTIETFAPGDHLSVDSNENDEGYLTAVSVKFEKAGTRQDRADAAETWDLPRLRAEAPGTKSASGSVQREPGDDRPVLRRKNDAGASAQPDADSSTAPAPSQTASRGSTTARPPADEPAPEPMDDRPTTMMRPPDPAPDPDDSGPPKLKRGPPPPRPATRASANAPGSSGASSGPEPAEIALDPGVTAPGAMAPGEKTVAPGITAIIPIEEDPVIQKAREVAAEFSGSLPNFFCKQVTTRYQTQNIKTGWQAQDIVTADVAYEDGRESYRNITVGNKPVKTSMEDIEGTHSTGEFATILENLFDPGTGATFRRSGQETMNHRSTIVFKYEVPRERSRWRIESPAQLYYPAYRGTIWVDKETSRVLRIEQQARNMPLLFPFDTVETAADYDYVRLSTLEPYLLPVDAEVLSCIRGTTGCMRNRIEFRNYRKFGAETDITFGPQ